MASHRVVKCCSTVKRDGQQKLNYFIHNKAQRKESQLDIASPELQIGGPAMRRTVQLKQKQEIKS